jgi:hypothetical protein
MAGQLSLMCFTKSKYLIVDVFIRDSIDSLISYWNLSGRWLSDGVTELISLQF